MRALLVVKSHLDVSTWLIVELSKLIEVEVIFIVAGDSHRESCYDFDLKGLPCGPIDDPDIVSGLLGDAYKLFKRCRRVEFYKLPSWSMKSPANIFHAFAFARRVRRIKPDIIHFNGSVGMLHPLYYGLTPGIPKVQSIHDSAPHSGENNWKKRYLQRFLVKNAHRITLFSEYCRKDLLGVYPFLDSDRVDVVPLGPIPLGWEISAARVSMRDPFHILFWGRISPYKGLKYLAKAFPLVKKQVPQARMTVAGDGDLGECKDSLLNMEGVTVLNRYILNSELLEMIESAAFGVLPYTDATQSGVAMVAFAHGLPLVATDVGGLPEVVIDFETGMLVPSHDVESLVAALVRLLGERGLQNELSSNINKMCLQGLSWEVAAEKYVEVYDKARSPKL